VFGRVAVFVALLVVGSEEVLGGLALLTGYYSNWESYLLVLIMLGSIFIAHNFFVDSSQLMTGLVRIVLIGYYIGLVQLVPNKYF
jgi:uncharacterized membrane protein YphA (DoxX/SURF4 family)